MPHAVTPLQDPPAARLPLQEVPRRQPSEGYSYGPDGRTSWYQAGPLTLESGEVLSTVKVAYRTWGRLAAEGDNAVVVCHALTGDANVDNWWASLVGPEGAIDTDRYFVISSNVLGSCYGTTGPTSINLETGRAWGPDFPAVTIRDMVGLQRKLAEHLGVKRVALVTGGSMGGMQVLEWAALYPDLVGAIAPIAVGADHSPWCIGISEAQRNAIFADPDWRDGHYSPDTPPRRGLAVARQIGMVSYRSPQSFANKFGRSRTDDGYEVAQYLRYQGEELSDRFDANAYVALTRAMDSHDLARGRGSKEQVLHTIDCPALVVGVTSDILYPLEEQQELVDLLPDAELAELDVPHGHDGFLIDAGAVGGLVAGFLDRLAGRGPAERSR
jgi:homoserine O-acetyltransferase